MQKDTNTILNEKILRIIFWLLAGLFGIALPLMSLDAGISGDEFVNYEHAEYVYNYFTEGDTTCMHGVRKGSINPTYLEY